MRKLELIDSFDCTPEEFWNNFFDPAFMANLDAEAGLTSREELMVVDDEEKFYTKFRITPRRELPPHVQQMLQNGLKLLQQVVNSGSSINDLPEPMRKMIEWGKSTFKDFLSRDPKSKTPPKTPDLTLSYVEEGTFDKQEQILRWSITPDLFKDVSDFKGTIQVVADGKGCKRTILGEINLGIPGAGEMLEQYLIDDIRRHHTKAAELTRKWLSERDENQD